MQRNGLSSKSRTFHVHLSRRVSAFLSSLAMSFFPRLRKKRKRRKNESITSRLSFGSSDIQATYYARFLTPQRARKISFFFVFPPPPRSSIMSLFISPTIMLPPRCSIRRPVLGVPLHAAPIVEKKLQLEQEISIAQPLFLLLKAVSQTESQFLVEGCYAFTRAMKEISAK